MDIKTFLEQIELLFIEDQESSDKFIIDRLNNQRSKLVRLIHELDKDIDLYFKVKRETVISNVRELYNELIASVQAFLEGRFGDSSNIIFDRFLDPESKKRVVLRARNILKNNELENNGQDNLQQLNLFRVRSNDTYNLYEKKEMFHIPFEKRGLVTNQRYSISGYPCLYLGSSIYGCWEATGRPNIDTFNVSSLKATSNLHLIDLRIPTLENIKPYFNEDYIYQLVLPLTCSLKIKNSSDSFKPEYIIPQNVLSGIIKRNHKHYDMDVNWDGIIYTANVYGQKHCLFGNKNNLINIVIPINTSKERGLCEKLVSLFTMTEPTSIISERLTKNIKITLLYKKDAFSDHYNNTMWGEIENTVLRKTHSKIE